MRNAVDKDSSTLRTVILYILGFLSILLIHNTYFQLKQLDTPTKLTCVSLFNKPFMKPDFERQPGVSRIPKSESLTN